MRPEILVIDNYDSFTFSLVDQLRKLGAEVAVLLNDSPMAALLGRAWSGVVISPGPGRPQDAGNAPEALSAFVDGGTPVLGVCLGHQMLAEHLGATLTHAPRLRHGHAVNIRHEEGGSFAGLPSPLRMGCYNSLCVRSSGLPAQLEVSAWDDDGQIMGLVSRNGLAESVQFHPESVLSEHGLSLMRNWLYKVTHYAASGGPAATTPRHDPCPSSTVSESP